MRGARTLLGIGALLASVAGAEPAPPLVVASRGLASIVVTGAGASGLRAGERLSVVRGEQVIGELEVSAAGVSSGPRGRSPASKPKRASPGTPSCAGPWRRG